MRWWEVKVLVPAEAVEAVTALLQDWPEVQGVAVEGRSDLHPPHPEWGEWFDERLPQTDALFIIVYVPETASAQELRARMAGVLGVVQGAGVDIGDGLSCVTLTMVDETDWENAWKAHYQPMQIGQRLAIVPTWQRDEYDAGARLVIELEPGMAFGTGTHPTTQLCMEALERIALDGQRVLDIGCGTGVLAMTAARLGAAEVVAVDIDPVAVASATTNVHLNGLADTVTVRQGNLLDGWQDGDYAVAVANILRDAVIALTPAVWHQLRAGGVFLSSGFVAQQASQVESALLASGFAEIRRWLREDWVVLSAVKPA